MGDQRQLRWNHLLVCDQEFGDREFFTFAPNISPQEHLIVFVNTPMMITLSSHTKEKYGSFLHINTLNNLKEYALEENSYKNRQKIIIPSPQLEGQNQSSGRWSNHKTFGHDLKKIPLMFYGKKAHQAASSILVKYINKNPNTHVYIGGLIDKSAYNLGDKHDSIKTYASYNEDTLKRLIEYLHQVYCERSDEYNSETDPDKILYLSEIDQLKHVINFNDDNNEYSVGLKLKRLIRQANYYGIYVIASSSADSKKDLFYNNGKDVFFEFEKSDNINGDDEN
jgi:hypothetical protein